jgi:DNA-binding transcriptional ArsR family regulator
METPSPTASRVPPELHPPLEKLLPALYEPIRWRILSELSSGEPRMVKELAKSLKCSPSLASKHVGVLRRAGLITVGRAGVYLIPPHFIVSAAERHLDFGHCLIRLPEPAAAE